MELNEMTYEKWPSLTNKQKLEFIFKKYNINWKDIEIHNVSDEWLSGSYYYNYYFYPSLSNFIGWTKDKVIVIVRFFDSNESMNPWDRFEVKLILRNPEEDKKENMMEYIMEKTDLKSYLINNWDKLTNKERIDGLLRFYLNIKWKDICYMIFPEKFLHSNDEYDLRELILWTTRYVVGINNSENGIFGYETYSLPRHP